MVTVTVKAYKLYAYILLVCDGFIIRMADILAITSLSSLCTGLLIVCVFKPTGVYRLLHAVLHILTVDGDSQGLTHSLVYCRAQKIDSDLLCVREDIQNYTATENPEIETANLGEVDNNEVTGASFDVVQDSQLLAGSIFQILLLLLQNHSDLSKNDKLVSTVNTIFVPLFGKWLRNKVDIYTKPDQVHRFLVLFRSAVWPQVEEQSAYYDIDKLKVIAKQCIRSELPSIVSFIAASQVDNILDDVLNATEHSELNEQLGLAILCQCMQNSLSVLK